MIPLISNCSMMPGWHQLVSMSGHVEESETARKLQLYATSIYQVHSFVCQLDYMAKIFKGDFLKMVKMQMAPSGTKPLIFWVSCQSILTKYMTPKYIVWLARCKVLSNIVGMENFTIEHTNLGTIFFFFFEKFHNRHVSFDLKYFKTHNKVPLSVNVFCQWVAEFGNFTIKTFNRFIKKHLIKFKHVNLF